MLKINCKVERTVGKANKGMNVEKIIIGFKNLKKKRKTPQNSKSSKQRQKFMTTIKNVTEGKKML